MGTAELWVSMVAVDALQSSLASLDHVMNGLVLVGKRNRKVGISNDLKRSNYHRQKSRKLRIALA